jgi:hypothetical protein
MGNKEQQQKVGIPAKRRGQQMGFAGQQAHNLEAAEQTPALRGRLQKSNKMFADKSAQQISTGATSERATAPSVPAMNSGGKPGETGGEIVFKRRLARRRRSNRSE